MTAITNLIGYFDAENRRQDKQRYCIGNELPQQPVGDKVLVLEAPPDLRSLGGVILPEKSVVKQQVSGMIVAAGLDALDKLRDSGLAVGHVVSWSKYAGVIAEWRRIIVLGTDPACEHADWGSMPQPEGSPKRYRCTACGAVMRVDNTLILSVDDLHSSVDLARQLRDGEVRIEFQPGDATTPNQHVLVRKE